MLALFVRIVFAEEMAVDDALAPQAKLFRVVWRG